MSTWLDNAYRYINNPYAIQRESLRQLEAKVNGDRAVVDPTSPFVHLMETSAVNSAAAVIKCATGLRKIFPRMAVTDEEIYNHMSDADFVGRFATPALGNFRLLLSRDEVMARAVDTGAGGVRKLTIPRNTSFEVAGYRFTMHYPIDIRIMAHGGLQIVFDTETTTPLETLTSNSVDWGVLNLDGDSYIRLDIPAYQFVVERTIAKLNQMTTFRQSITLKDDFYHARVYRAVGTEWEEIITTHSDQVFDPYKPTALLKLMGRVLTVEIPTVYLTQGMVDTELRIDVYTTKGAIDVPLTGYMPNSYVIRWEDLAASGDTPWTAPMKVFSRLAIFANVDVRGGAGQISTPALRERMITSALGAPDMPITNAQLTDRLQRRGYSMVTDIDQVTNRQFLATRLLPTPTDGTLVSGSGSTMQTLQATMEELVEHSYCVTDNGARITLLPSALYTYVDGLISVVPETMVNTLNALPVDVRARRINEGRYLYSPFHYVLDINDDRFALRPYYLDNPSIESKSFVAENPTTGIGVTVGDYQIERVDGGYMLVIITESGDAWKALPDADAYCQVGYIPSGEIDLAYQNGVLAGKTDLNERIYTFFLGTNFDLDANHNLLINTFQMYDNGPRPHGTALSSPFQVFFAGDNLAVAGLTRSEIDDDIGSQMLPATVYGLVQETLNIKLGVALTGLWASARSVVASEDYARYTADVPWLYEKTVFKRDPVGGGILIERDPVTHGLTYVVLHNAGDPVLDDQGQPMIRYQAGDVMVDAEGKPIAISSRKMQRQADLYMFDGVFWFATDESAITYRNLLARTVVDWIQTDIATIQGKLFEKSSLYFYSQCTLGMVKVIVGEERTLYLDAAQGFKVEFSVSAQVFRDGELRATLEEMAIKVIDDELKKPVVTTNNMVSMITEQAGSDIIAVKLTGLGGVAAHPVITMVDDASRLSIRRKAVDRADGTITVRDDVEISFIQHKS